MNKSSMVTLYKGLQANHVIIILLLICFSPMSSATDCVTLNGDMTCNSDADCSDYVINLDMTACVNCLVVSSGSCGSASDTVSGGVCSHYVVSSTNSTKCQLDCT